MASDHAPLGTLVPGTVGPVRTVPPHIERPEYVGKDRELPFTGSEVKDAETLERIRRASKIAAQALEEVGRNVVPGITTDELDRIGHEFMCDHGAYPSTLHYQPHPRQVPFLKSLCSSINEVICHGIPDSRPLRDGDICNIDVTGWIGSSGSLTLDEIRSFRAVDTRLAQGISTTLPAGSRTAISLTGLLDSGGVGAIALNVTAIRPENRGFLTIDDCSTTTPTTSTLNYAAGEIRGNNGIFTLG